jgi:3-oxoacyl-[acyl-carrier-protein] synthase-3
MDGTNLYKAAAQAMPSFIDRLCRGGFPKPSEADWVVPHQASATAMALLARKLGVRGDRLVDIFDSHGNQVSASMPTALAALWSSGKIKKGDRILLLGTGAGLALGGAWLRATEDLP